MKIPWRVWQVGEQLSYSAQHLCLFREVEEPKHSCQSSSYTTDYVQRELHSAGGSMKAAEHMYALPQGRTGGLREGKCTFLNCYNCAWTKWDASLDDAQLDQ